MSVRHVASHWTNALVTTPNLLRLTDQSQIRPGSNRTRIEWTTYSWNPLGWGCDLHCSKDGKPYCYSMNGARRHYFMHLALFEKGKRRDPPCELCRDFVPHFHPERLQDPYGVKQPCKVFVCSTSDLWARWTLPTWRSQVLHVVEDPALSYMTFQTLTKQPHLIPIDHAFPANVWMGATVTNINEIHRIEEIKRVNCGVRFASFEPLFSGFDGVSLKGLDWIIVGKLTGRKFELDPAWVESLLSSANDVNIPVFIKNNVKWPEKMQNFPN